MAQLIDQISNSGLFAQSAYSAAVATNDDLGRKISTTYLTAVDLSPYATETLVEETSGAITSLIPTDYYPDTNPSGFISGVDLTPYATTAEVESISSMLSASIDYVSANAGGMTGDYVSGTNTASVTDIYTYNYSATISGDVSVDVEQKLGDYTNNTWHYSLFNVGSAVENKLNAEYISASNTIKKLGEYDNHYEVVGKSYREANVKTISAYEVSNDRVEFRGEMGYYLKSAIITIESDTIGSYMPDWTLQSSAGGSAVLTKIYADRKSSDSTYLYGDWNITNIDASATVYNGYEIAELAFKDEIPSGGGNPEVESYVQTNSANIDDTVTSYQTNSGDYLKESELGYNAVDEVSAINGSAIAQYGAEKQWLVHDDTIVSISNSAQYALGVAIDNVARLMGVDETVLWSGDEQLSIGEYIELSESPRNFEYVRLDFAHQPGWGGKHSETIPNFGDSTSGNFVIGENWFRNAAGYNNMWHNLSYETFNSANNRIYHNSGFQGIVNNTAWNTNGNLQITYYKVIGIGRKQ